MLGVLCFVVVLAGACSDVLIVDPYEEGGSAPCMRLCAGTTGKGRKTYNTLGLSKAVRNNSTVI